MSDTHLNATFEQITPGLTGSEAVLIYAGAGMSVGLGMKTYWSGSHSSYGSEESVYGFTAFEHASALLWKSHPEQQRAYYRDRLEEFNNKLEHSTENVYTRLLDWLNRAGKEYFVVTSNIDNAFIHYGFDPNRIYEVHGNHTWAQCVDCGIVPNNLEGRCPKCASGTRPNILMFDDFWFNETREHSQWGRHSYFLEDMLDRKDMNGKVKLTILEIGVGTTVQRVRDMAMKSHYQFDRPLIHINPTFDPDNGYGILAETLLRDRTRMPQLWVREPAESFGEFLTTLP